jgi:hypothetical protein
MKLDMETVYSWLEKILIPLLIAAIIALFSMYNRLNAVEMKDMKIEGDVRDMKIDILAIRCAVTKDEFTCLKLRAMEK